jgi:hypothetical protein
MRGRRRADVASNLLRVAGAPIAILLRHGLLQPGFIPPAPVRELRCGRSPPQNSVASTFADPGGGICLKAFPTGGKDDEPPTCVETDLTERGVVASERI